MLSMTAFPCVLLPALSAGASSQVPAIRSHRSAGVVNSVKSPARRKDGTV